MMLNLRFMYSLKLLIIIKYIMFACVDEKNTAVKSSELMNTVIMQLTPVYFKFFSILSRYYVVSKWLFLLKLEKRLLSKNGYTCEYQRTFEKKYMYKKNEHRCKTKPLIASI